MANKNQASKGLPPEEVDGKNEWEEVMQDRFQFTDVGDKIEGILVAKGEQQMANGKVGAYTVQVEEDGEKVAKSFLGSTTLDRLLAQVKVGKMVRIEFTGTDKTGQGRNLKQFTVQQRNA